MKPVALLALTSLILLPLPAAAQPREETVTPKFSQSLPNVPGKSLTSVVVSYAPGAKSRPHHHASSAFIYGYVLSGTIRTQVEGGPVQTLKAGETFMEMPGAHHVLGENASKTEPASFLVVFVVDSNDKVLTTYDK